MKILSFGSCNIDYVYNVEHIVIPGETLSSSNLQIFPGGKGLNQSIAAARAGANVFHAGCIGNDGEMLRNVLIQSGVNVKYLKNIDVKTGHAIIQKNTYGENSIIIYGGANQTIEKAFIDEVIEDFSSEDILVLQNELNNIDYLIEKAYKAGMKIVLNPAPFDSNLKDIDFNKLNFIILNEVEAKEFTGKSEPEEIICAFKENYPNLKVVLTLGKTGCIYFDKNETLYQPSFNVNTVDTTAAGDTFIGYFIVEISKGNLNSEAIKVACAASALAVTKSGASPSIPCRAEVLEALKSLKVNSVEF